MGNDDTDRRRSSAIHRDGMLEILLYIPNLVGYVRFALLLLMFAFHNTGLIMYVVITYLVFSFLDIVDGVTARQFDQKSQFGAFMDVVLDNFGRTFLWAGYSPVCAIFGSIEWMTFSLIQAAARQGMSDWKTKHFETAPNFIKYIFSNNFKNPLGAWCMAGQFLLPLQLYAGRYEIEVPYSQVVLVVMVLGRGLGLAIEMFVFYGAVENMLSIDASANRLRVKNKGT